MEALTIAVAIIMGVTLGAPGVAVDPLPITPNPTEPTPVVAELPPVSECESGGDYLAENDVSTASGRWMFIDSTFQGTQAGSESGYSHASDAPPSVQDAAARELWNNGAGASHWEQCL